MVRTRLTKVGQLFGGLMLLFYVASVTSQSGLLLLFIGLVGGCFAVNWTFARRNVRNLQITAPQFTQVVEGEPAREPWKIHNIGTKHSDGVDLLNEAGLLMRIPMISAGESLSVVPRITHHRRGVFPQTSIVIASAAPYGLFRATRQLDLAGELIVLPRIYDTFAPAGAGLEHISGGRFRGGRRVSHGTHFAGVRGWQAGDSIKQVDWKSTARRDQLMVKTYEEELGGRLSIILDCLPADVAIVDNAVRAAGSLAAAALQDGSHVELRDSQEEALHLAPFSDEGEMLLRLARYEASPLSFALDDCWRKSTVAIVGTRWRDDWLKVIAAARTQNRRVHIYLPVGERVPEVDADLAHFTVTEILEFSPAHA